jgi:two-component system response regulator
MNEDHLIKMERFERFFRQAEDLFFILDDRGRFIDLNPKFAELLGYSPDELKGRTSKMIAYEEDLPKLREFFQRVKKGETSKMEFRGVARDGRIIWFEIIEWLSVTGEVEGIARNITDRKVAENKIKHLSLVLKSIRNVNQLITRERDRNRLLERACKTLAEVYSRAFILLTDGTLYHGGMEDKIDEIQRIDFFSLPCVKIALEKDFAVLNSECFDCILFKEDEKRFACKLEYRENLYGVLCIALPEKFAHEVEEQDLFREVAGDISFALYSIDLEEERRMFEKNLMESEERFRKIFDNTPNLIAIIDAEGNFVTANPAMKKSLGLDPAGRNIYDILEKDVADLRMRHIKTALKGNIVTFEDERKGRVFRNTFIPVKLAERDYCIVIANEITDFVNLQNLLRTINRINRFIAREKDESLLLERTCKELSGLGRDFSIWIALIKDGRLVEKGFGGIELKPHPTEMDMENCHIKALESKETLKVLKEERKKICPFDKREFNCYVIPMKVNSKVIGFADIHSERELSAEEIEIFETLMDDLAFAINAREIERQRELLFRQLDKNIETFAILLDQIRNPLAIITGITELMVDNEYVRETILKSGKKIEELINRLDRGWLESEEIRKFLRKHYE